MELELFNETIKEAKEMVIAGKASCNALESVLEDLLSSSPDIEYRISLFTGKYQEITTANRHDTGFLTCGNRFRSFNRNHFTHEMRVKYRTLALEMFRAWAIETGYYQEI